MDLVFLLSFSAKTFRFELLNTNALLPVWWFDVAVGCLNNVSPAKMMYALCINWFEYWFAHNNNLILTVHVYGYGYVYVYVYVCGDG